MSTLFVGNLSWDTSDETLASHISGLGIRISSVSIQFQSNGRSKGWGLVTVDGDADAAIGMLNEQELDGRNLICRMDRGPSEKKPRAPRGGGGGGGGGRGGGRGGEPSTKLFVGNLSFDTTEDTLQRIFSEYGYVESCEIALNDEGRSRGWAYVVMGSIGAAESAAAGTGGSEIDGRSCKVEFARPPRAARQPRGGGGGGGGYVPSGDANPNCVYIGNLPWSVTSVDLSEYLGCNAEVIIGRNGRSRGYGIATCASPADAQQLIADFNDCEYDGRRLVARLDRG